MHIVGNSTNIGSMPNWKWTHRNQQIGIDLLRFIEDEKFEGKGDWEKIILETHGNASTSKKVEWTQVAIENPAVLLNEALNYINRLRQLICNQGKNKMVDGWLTLWSPAYCYNCHSQS